MLRYFLFFLFVSFSEQSKCAYGLGKTSIPATCLTGRWYYAPDPSTIIDFVITSQNSSYIEYAATCVGANWATANASFPVNGTSFSISFDEPDSPPNTMVGFPDAACAVINWEGRSKPWCRNASACQIAPPLIPPFWLEGKVHLVEVSHSDIGWLGVGRDRWGPGLPDLIDDTKNIGTALDMMQVDPTFAWQHECILFLRCFVEMYPEREAELVQRIAEGRFDIGATFSEPLESTLLNELLARQMYTGRKWFVERYPGLDSARVAFHQDGPLRALQMPQVYRKAGVKYMKTSRWSDNIQAWHGADDDSYLLSMTELHYGQADCTVEDLTERLSTSYRAYVDAGLPPQAIQALGIDYSPPVNYSEFLSQWASQNETHPPMVYSTFHAALKALDVGAPGLRHVKGERPNLWYIEGCPPHHNICGYLRDGARTLPSAELWSSFSSLSLDGQWGSYPTAQLTTAWLNLTLTDHGIAGEPTPRNFSTLPSWFINENSPPTWDLAYADKWSRAAAMGSALSATAQNAIALQINTTGAPAAASSKVLLFNPLSWSRNASVLIPLSTGAPCPTVASASNGAIIPSQCSPIPTNSLVFIAQNVPSLGYSSFYLLPPSSSSSSTTTTTTTTTLETTASAAENGKLSPGDPWNSPFINDFYRITPALGGLASLVDLSSGLEVFNTTSGYKAGEWMSLEYTGMGASETRSYDSAGKGAYFQRLSDFPGAVWTCIESGPIRTVFSTAPVATNHSTVTLQLTVYSQVPKIDFSVSLTDWDSAFGVANRVVFPLATSARNVSYAVPFGVVRVGWDEAENGEDDVWLTNPGPAVPPFERGWAMHPREISDWMAAEGGVGEEGLLISSSVGTFDWVDCSGLYPSTSVVLAPELMLHTNSNRGPYLPEPGNHSFFFSLVPISPSSGGWRGTWRRGVEANNNVDVLVLPQGGGGGGSLPTSASLLSVLGDGGGSWVTAVKKEDDGVKDSRGGLIVRLFNVDGIDRNVTLSLTIPPGLSLKAADKVSLIELDPESLQVSNNSLALRLNHWAIETVRLSVI